MCKAPLSSQRTAAKQAKKKKEDEDMEEEEDEPVTKKTQQRGAKAKTTAKLTKGSKKAAESEEDEEEMEEEPQPKQRGKGGKAAQAKKKAKVQEDDEDEEDEEDPPKRGKGKQKKAAAPKKSPVKNSKTDAPDASERNVGEVDPEFLKTHPGAVVATDDDGNPYDAMLCFVEGNSDKYYVLQVISIQNATKFVCFSRWGRTGAKGQQQTQGPFKSVDDAVEAFEGKFLEKTANHWTDFVEGNFKHKKGKYDCLASPIAAGVTAARNAGVNWEYEVTDNVAGKANGWYAYDPDNADQVEAVFQAFKQNPSSATNLSKRIISSDSSGFQYEVDLIKSTQRNVSTGKVRSIRRVNPNGYQLKTTKAKTSKSKTQTKKRQKVQDEEDEDESLQALVTMDPMKLLKDGIMLNREAMEEFVSTRYRIDITQQPLSDLTAPTTMMKLERLLVDAEQTVLSSYLSADDRRRKLKDVSDQLAKILPGLRTVSIADEQDLQSRKSLLKDLKDCYMTLEAEGKQDFLKEALNVKETEAIEHDDSLTEWKAIKQYCEVTKDRGVELLHVYRVQPLKENDPQAFTSLSDRKLLWFDSASVSAASAASLVRENLAVETTGRIGRGYYFASELSKAMMRSVPITFKASSSSPAVRLGVAFLAECALGEVKEMTRDCTTKEDVNAKTNTVVGRGRTEPDVKKEIAFMIDKRFVAVPQGRPVVTTQTSGVSSFSQSMYCLKNAKDQARLRFICVFKLPAEDEIGSSLLGDIATKGVEIFGSTGPAAGSAVGNSAIEEAENFDDDEGEGDDDDDDEDYEEDE